MATNPVLLNPLVGTPMGPLNGVVPPNPLMQDAMTQPPQIPPPSMAPPPALPTRENLTKALDANKGISDLLAKLMGNPVLASKDVVDTLGTAVGAGHMSASQAASELAKMPQEPEALRRWVQTHFLQNMQMGRRLVELGSQLPPVLPVKA